MKKLLLLTVLQIFTINIWADSDIDFIYQYQDSDKEIEYKIPITGGINGDNLNLDYKGSDYANVSVKDKNGSVVYQNSINGKNTINLSGYTQGDYTVKVEDSKGNAAVANFQVKK